MNRYTELNSKAEIALKCAKELSDDLMEEYTVKTLPVAGVFCYIQGVLLLGYQKLYKVTGDKKYYDYAKSWIDYHVTENGDIVDPDKSVPWFTIDTLDYRQPGNLLFDIYDDTHEEKYKRALITLAETMKDFPKNSVGSFWHNAHSCKEQVWLDGLYMISPLLAHYAAEFDKKEFFDTVALQITNIYENMRDENGLLLHGWCEDKSAAWAKGERGLSQTVWARACGWVVVAIADILDYFPKEHAEYSRIIETQNNLLRAISKYQDSDGLWHQVLDKPDNADNPQESSASCLFIYAAAKGMRGGYIGDYTEMIDKGLDGILNHIVKRNDESKIVISKICAGLCIVTGDYKHYVSTAEFIDNDSHGTGVFVQMCAEVYELCKSMSI